MEFIRDFKTNSNKDKIGKMNYYTNIFKGFTWMALLRLIIRLFGFARIAILARILSPQDFGVYGIAVLVLAFMEIFTETGVNVFLVQSKDKIEEYIDTAWIVSIIRGIFISLIIYLMSTPVATFFSSPGSEVLIKTIAIIPLLRGFLNPSEIKFLKELNFKAEFSFRTVAYLADSLVSVILAVVLKNPIGIIYGNIFGVLVELILSFAVIRPVPRIRLEIEKAKRIIRRGRWVGFSGIFNYLSQQGDDGVVAKLLGNAQLGYYQVAYKISTLPLTEITQAMGKVTFPVYSLQTKDKKKLKKYFFHTTLGMISLVVPFGAIIYFFPEIVVKIILGDKWMEVVGVLKVLAIFGVIRAISGLFNSLFFALDKQEYVARISFVQFLFLAILIIPLTVNYGIIGAGYASIVSSLAPLLLVFIYFRREMGSK